MIRPPRQLTSEEIEALLAADVPARLATLDRHAGIGTDQDEPEREDGERPNRQVRAAGSRTSPERIIAPTVEALGMLAPSLLVPAHCTGWKAVHRLAGRFPDAFVQYAVGTTIEL